MRRITTALALTIVLFSGHPVLADERCNAGQAGTYMAGKPQAPWSVAIAFSSGPVPLNSAFDAIISICSQAGKQPTYIKVDANMPAHKHGMNYRPEIRKRGEETYIANNLVFHMPGLWQLVVTVYENETAYSFVHEVTIP